MKNDHRSILEDQGRGRGMIAILINEQGRLFDSGEFTSVKKAREWAKGRGGVYRLRITDDSGEYILHEFRVKNDRFHNVMMISV